MAEDRLLLAQIDVSIRNLEKTMRRAGVTVDKASDKMEKRWNANAKRIEARSERMSANVRNAIAGIALGLAGREVVAYGDAWADMSNKIAAAGEVAGMQGRSLDALQKSAASARQELDPYVDLYARLLRSSKGIADSEEEVARATLIASKAFKAGGASAQEQAAGILQLGQALGSGFLQGDELRSIRENAPLVAKAIADAMGVSIGELKKLGAEGKLTSDIVFKALLNGADDIEAAFAVTIPRGTDATRIAFDRLKLKVGEYLVQTNAVGTVSEAMGDAINFVANNVDAFADAIVIAGAALGGYLGATAVASVITGLSGVADGAKGAAKAMAVLDKVTKLFGGPWVLAISAAAAGLAYLALSGNDAAGSLDRATGAVDKHHEAQKNIKEDTDKLTEANKKLKDAIDLQGPAAEATARREISAIQSRIRANQVLAQSYEVSARAELSAANKSIDSEQAKLNGLRAQISAANEMRGGQSLGSVDDVLDSIAGKQSSNQRLTRVEDMFLKQLEAVDKLKRRAEEAKGIIDAIGKSQGGSGLGEDMRDLLDSLVSSGGGGSSSSAPASESLSDDGRDDALGMLDSLREAVREAHEDERGEIQRTLEARLAAIDASKMTEDEAREARLAAEFLADKQLSDLKAEEAARETALLEKIKTARDEALNRTTTNLERERLARQAEIETEIQDEARKKEALAALEEEFAVRKKSIEDRVLGEGDGDTIDAAVERVRMEEEAKLLELEDWYQQNLERFADYEARKAEIVAESEEEIKGIRQDAIQAQLRAYGGLFQNVADGLKGLLGEQSGAYKAALAAAKAFAIADSLIQIAQAGAQVMADPSKVTLEQKLAAGGIIAAQGAALISSITGAREKGGPVRGGGTYLVGEKGPELVQMGGSGQVTSNENLMKALGQATAPRIQAIPQAPQVVNVYNNAPGTQAREQRNPDGSIDIIVEALAAEMDRGGGPLTNAMERNYGLNRGNAA